MQWQPLIIMGQLMCMLYYLGHIMACLYYFFSTPDWRSTREQELIDNPDVSIPLIKPQLQIRAGAEKSTDTREIITRYRKLGITRSILRCAVAVAMLIMYGSEH